MPDMRGPSTYQCLLTVLTLLSWHRHCLAYSLPKAPIDDEPASGPVLHDLRERGSSGSSLLQPNLVERRLLVTRDPAREYNGVSNAKPSGEGQYPAWLTPGADLTPSLPQHVTNGNSVLGTKQAPRLKGVKAGASRARARSLIGGYPETGRTIYKEWRVSKAMIQPDGVPREAIIVNGAFPGPTIEANYGDWFEINVFNDLKDDGTSLHWHGMLQKETQWLDGVPSVHQCPIAPGKNFTYRFRADQVGSAWWHSHFSAQYSSGAFGAMIIHGDNENYGYDDDLGPVFLNDWYHAPFEDTVDKVIHNASPVPPPSNNVLINGKMNFPCQNITTECHPNAGVSKFYVTPGKKYRIRLINASASAAQKFSVDGHKFTIYAIDFTPIKPYESDLIYIGIGQRVDVVMEAVGAKGSSFWMRSDLGDYSREGVCNDYEGANTRTAVAAVYYDGADDNTVPNTTSTVAPERLLTCTTDPLNVTIPIEVRSAQPQGAFTTLEMHVVSVQENSTGQNVNRWLVNNQYFRANYSNSLLQKVQSNTLAPQPEMALFDMGTNQTIRLVIYNYNPFTYHPMHLHGHNFQILAEGWGTWDGHITNPDNPVRRDVHINDRARGLPPDITPSYIVIQFFADNPGVWPFHCHFAWHSSAGLFTNLLLHRSEVEKVQIPDAVQGLCKGWDDFYAANKPLQIDAGV